MKVVELPKSGPLLSTEADAIDVIGSLYGEDADWIAIPVERMASDVWQLKTRLAGLFVQKLLNYRLHPAFIGDLSAEIAASDALRDYVRECNRRRDVLFVPTRAELDALL
ncbi:MAG: DUF4180 domain-containing protein [Alphaproteobacteria bacterium]|nr:MAG: DUF4180 domain-containing protein [Alphaproteobacteria bacterium]